MEVSRSLARVLSDLLFRHWAMKTGAFLLAVVVFVFTRDEVTRAFEISLQVVPDPDRVLLTQLPESVQVHVRGPWTRVNRLHDYDFGTATLNLSDAQPGPLEIDRASVVMPAGVVLAGVYYDRVDLRFESVIEREIPIVVDLAAKPSSDYRLVRTEVSPRTWRVRGGRSQLEGVVSLSTDPVDLSAARETVEANVALVSPPGQARLLETSGKRPTVVVKAIVEPVFEERKLEVKVPGAEELGIASSHRVHVSGTLRAWRAIDESGVEDLVSASIVETNAAEDIELHFELSERLGAELRAGLRVEGSVVRVPLPAGGPPVPESKD